MNGRKKPCPLQTVNDTKRICEQGTETDDIKHYSTTNSLSRNKIQKKKEIWIEESSLQLPRNIIIINIKWQLWAMNKTYAIIYNFVLFIDATCF